MSPQIGTTSLTSGTLETSSGKVAAWEVPALEAIQPLIQEMIAQMLKDGWLSILQAWESHMGEIWESLWSRAHLTQLAHSKSPLGFTQQTGWLHWLTEQKGTR